MQPAADFAYVKPVYANAAAACGLSTRVGGERVKQVAHAPAGALGELPHRGEGVGVKPIGVFKQRQEHGHCGAGVGEGAVGVVKADVEQRRHLFQAVARQVGAHDVGEVEGVHDGVGEVDAGAFKKA